MTLMAQAQSAAVSSQTKIGTPKNMKILMTKVHISFTTQATQAPKLEENEESCNESKSFFFL